MVVTIFSWFLAVFLSIFLAWLAVRAWRNKNILVKMVGGVLSSLAALTCLSATVISLVGFVKFNSTHNVTIPDSQDTGTSYAGTGNFELFLRKLSFNHQ